MNNLIELAAGNPGAMGCLIGLLAKENLEHSISILATIESLEIKGTDIYVLWSDLCGQDYGLMSYLCESVPNDILKKACSVQDYSGRELVKDYVEYYKAAQLFEAEHHEDDHGEQT